MAKTDRIPSAWPALMSDEVAARYLDMSVSTFKSLASSKRLPKGKRVFGTEMVRWRRDDLDAAVRAEYGETVDRSSETAAALGAADWMEALRNAR